MARNVPHRKTTACHRRTSVRDSEDSSGGNPTLQVYKRPTVVYLDQNFWIDLSRARLGLPVADEFRVAFQLLAKGVADGRLVVPLSSTHYLELSKVTDVGRRHEVATTMAELSKYRTMADLHSLLRYEFRSALAAHLGYAPPAPLAVFGYGASFAFGQGVGWYRVTGDPETLDRIRKERGQDYVDRLEVQQNARAQFRFLRGPSPHDEPALRLYGYRPEAVFAVAEERARREAALAAKLTPHQRSHQLPDIVAARELIHEFGDNLTTVLAEYHWTWDDFFERGKEWAHQFLSRVPTAHVWLSLKIANHRNRDKPWVVNDVHDIDGLSRAVPYCDVVAAEKHAYALLRALKLNARYSTHVVRGASQLVSVLSAEAPAAVS